MLILIASLLLAFAPNSRAECPVAMPGGPGTASPEQNCPEEVVQAFRLLGEHKIEEAESRYKAAGTMKLEAEIACADHGYGFEALDLAFAREAKLRRDSKPRVYNVPGYDPMKLEENSATLQHFYKERSSYPNTPSTQYWIGVVPGDSEERDGKKCHHCAPSAADEASGRTISHNFEKRLDKLFLLMDNGNLKYAMISGGAIDPTRPDYVEAIRGRDFFLRKYASQWAARHPGDDLAKRLFVEPVAEHSTTNIRNTDKFCLGLGVAQSLIVTDDTFRGKVVRKGTLNPLEQGEMPITDYFGAYASQGFFYSNGIRSTANIHFGKEVGYVPGEFDDQAAAFLPNGEGVQIVRHDHWKLDRLRADGYGP